MKFHDAQGNLIERPLTDEEVAAAEEWLRNEKAKAFWRAQGPQR